MSGLNLSRTLCNSRHCDCRRIRRLPWDSAVHQGDHFLTAQGCSRLTFDSYLSDVTGKDSFFVTLAKSSLLMSNIFSFSFERSGAVGSEVGSLLISWKQSNRKMKLCLGCMDSSKFTGSKLGLSPLLCPINIPSASRSILPYRKRFYALLEYQGKFRPPVTDTTESAIRQSSGLYVNGDSLGSLEFAIFDTLYPWVCARLMSDRPLY